MTRLTLGTRGSALALWQAHTVAAALECDGQCRCELQVIKTTGDRLAEVNLSKIGGKQVFVKEIEHALAEGAIDLAVHSAKDMPAELPEGLTVAGVLPREDPRDAVVLPADRADLPPLDRSGATPINVGSGSIRRVAQLSRAWPAAVFSLIRGNIETRLRKLDDGDYDLVILAAAGLRRLGHGDRIATTLEPALCLPAPGQGIVAIETREDDVDTMNRISAVSDPLASAALEAERKVLIDLGGGCQVPIGALATIVDDQLTLQALVASPDGSVLLRRERRGNIADAATIGASVAAELLEDGAGPILASSTTGSSGAVDA